MTMTVNPNPATLVQTLAAQIAELERFISPLREDKQWQDWQNQLLASIDYYVETASVNLAFAETFTAEHDTYNATHYATTGLDMIACAHKDQVRLLPSLID